MNTSAIALLGYAAWTLLLLGGIAVLRGALTVSGQRAANSFAISGEDVSPFSARLCRAHANCYENLPAFASIVLLAIVSGNAHITDPLALWALAARIGQSTAHLVAQSEQIKFDEELLFVASVLHDLGLTESRKCKEPACACFAVEGARAAEQFAAEIGWENERRERLSEAISLHLNVRVGLHYGPEAHLLHEGAALDVIGARIRELHPASVESVLKQYPRVTFKQEMSAAMKEQARERPHSRAAFLVGLGFVGMIRSAPLEDPLAPNKSLHTDAPQAARR